MVITVAVETHGMMVAEIIIGAVDVITTSIAVIIGILITGIIAITDATAIGMRLLFVRMSVKLFVRLSKMLKTTEMTRIADAVKHFRLPPIRYWIIAINRMKFFCNGPVIFHGPFLL